MDITLLPIWSDEKSISFFPKSHKPSLIPRKMPDKCKLKDILHNTQAALFKTTVKVVKNDESEKPLQISGDWGYTPTKWGPGEDSGKEIEH